MKPSSCLCTALASRVSPLRGSRDTNRVPAALPGLFGGWGRGGGACVGGRGCGGRAQGGAQRRGAGGEGLGAGGQRAPSNARRGWRGAQRPPCGSMAAGQYSSTLPRAAGEAGGRRAGWQGRGQVSAPAVRGRAGAEVRGSGGGEGQGETQQGTGGRVLAAGQHPPGRRPAAPAPAMASLPPPRRRRLPDPQRSVPRRPQQRNRAASAASQPHPRTRHPHTHTSTAGPPSHTHPHTPDTALSKHSSVSAVRASGADTSARMAWTAAAACGRKPSGLRGAGVGALGGSEVSWCEGGQTP